ncbi:hypothetical protein BDU57DRAFT_442027 [Ampelomyces quisqualis]|uniref:Histidine kinase group protein n=1 Tax=Ampelomyces quisqualis TaxID=50730 RepID=A0A6A5QZ77_AMPQU|nr:hypothetical protein BDU57DRAFT_442027 [Ampelomyces quisqualis]
MARNKKSAQPDAGPGGSAAASTPPPPPALIICRNKHWRYISSFHGPWLQLPPEVLESLAHANYFSPRPHPIDPAVFYDLVKIRRAVDEATTLAVRAASGLTAAALGSSLHAHTSLLGGAAALGMGHGGGGGKLSRERKHRMRELATAKLSQAYHLDEIAASVATMQSASTLEDVAHLVLQRSPHDADARYVHFFHEKIPSRMMAQCTPLDALNAIIAERPNDASPLRTRALTRIFQEDYVNSARDLSEALSAARFLMQQHRAGRDQLVLAKTYQEQHGRDWRQEVKLADQDQPSSLETQLLFHRAGVYFTIACGHVHAALDGLREAEDAKAQRDARTAAGEDVAPESPGDVQGHRCRAEARKQVRQNAKRALRDYNAFLSHFDYTPGISAALAEEFLRRLGHPSNTVPKETYQPPLNRLLDSSSPSSFSPTSDALVRRPPSTSDNRDRSTWPKVPPPEIFKLSQLFDAVPPSTLPPYPAPTPTSPASAAASAFADSHESITYHPLLTDALHSLLLCHALLQTPQKEHLRHAHNAARVARICDGYPIFLAARSPARADWIEVLRRTHNFIHLDRSWEALCRPAPLPGQSQSNGKTEKAETEKQKRDRIKHEAILEALADERVVDEDSFQRAVHAREKRYADDEAAERSNGNSANGNGSGAKRWAQDDGREYPISTERAEAITRWVREAPPVLASSNAGGKRRKGKGKKKVGVASAAGGKVEKGVEELVEGLDLNGHEDDDGEGEGEEEDAR